MRRQCPLGPPTGSHTTYDDAVWINIVAVGAIIKIDFIEGLRCRADHFTPVVESVPVLCDHRLPQGHLPEKGGLQKKDTKLADFSDRGTRKKQAGGGINAGDTYDVTGCLVFEAGDRHDVRPIVWFYGHSGDLGTRDVEGGGAMLIRALDAGSRNLLHPLPAVHTFLGKNTGLC